MFIEAPKRVRDAIMSPATRHFSRIEFYERDGVTQFRPGDMNRLLTGSVPVDSDRDERRTFDVEIENFDQELQLHPDSVWYDKIVRIFKGVYFDNYEWTIPVAVIGNMTTLAQKEAANRIRMTIMRAGFTHVDVVPNVTRVSQLDGYDVVVEAPGTQPIKNGDLLRLSIDAGKQVVTITQRAAGIVPISASTSQAATNDILARPTNDSGLPGAFGWDFYEYDSKVASDKITGLHELAQVIAKRSDGSPAALYHISRSDAHGCWVHLHMVPPEGHDGGFDDLLRAVITQLNPNQPASSWEVQIGEFEIDKIDQSHFPHTMRISGRDRSKTCQGSKVEAATGYKKGTKVSTAVRSLAANAGIRKFDFDDLTDTLGAEVVFEAGTSRWEMMKKLAEAAVCDLYFDPLGNLVLKKFEDPARSPIVEEFNTGPRIGNMIEFSKSSTDSEMFNIVLASSESSDSDAAVISATARNNDPTSPTSIQRIGQRLKRITSALITSKAQAQKIADSAHSRSRGCTRMTSTSPPCSSSGSTAGR